MNRTDIEYIIEKLESYKPDNIYNGYNSEREKRDQRVSEVLDSIIAEIKIEPVEESKWMKCSEGMPENGKSVLVVITQDGYTDICSNKIKSLPAVQPEQKIGHWIICSDGYYPYCSQCLNEPKNRIMTKYCGECGAKMGK